MYPHTVRLLGLSLSVWNAALLVAALCGYFTLRVAARAQPGLNFLAVRYLVTLYLAVLGAQLFAYAFDVNTSLRPPFGAGYAAYYLSPVAGPKTLYGAVVALPVAVAVARIASSVRFARALDVWTPALFVVMAGARAGCLLQGCCYGVRSEWFGVWFPVGSPVYYEQLRAGLIHEGSVCLGVVPTQAIEAALLAVVAIVSMKRVRDGTGQRRGPIQSGPAGLGGLEARSDRPIAPDGRIFAAAAAAYSVFRFAIEFVRGDAERGIYGGLATSQWIALLVLGAASAALWRRGRA